MKTCKGHQFPNEHFICLIAAFKARNRPLSRGGHFESQGNKKLCFCPSSLALDERLDGKNLLFQHCVIKSYTRFLSKPFGNTPKSFKILRKQCFGNFDDSCTCLVMSEKRKRKPCVLTNSRSIRGVSKTRFPGRGRDRGLFFTYFLLTQILISRNRHQLCIVTIFSDIKKIKKIEKMRWSSFFASSHTIVSHFSQDSRI